ncbi:MAG: hypothetical protein A2X81_12780 [Desulfobacterales bacterium GWB2_56_26]|nr:MAG: hypothetical protein A2X81_12780 [Desulfobacterales bacterium GWB2_56_26]
MLRLSQEKIGLSPEIDCLLFHGPQIIDLEVSRIKVEEGKRMAERGRIGCKSGANMEKCRRIACSGAGWQ